MGDLGLLFLVAVVIGAGFLWRTYARRKASVPPCPKCDGTETAIRVDSDTERVDFQEIIGGFSANVEPVLTLRVTYACKACSHRWTQKERRYT